MLSALCVAVGFGVLGAAPIHAAALCIPLIMTCSPEVDPPSDTPIVPPVDVGGILGELLNGGEPVPDDAPALGGLPVVLAPDPGAPIMTLPAAQLGGSSISFSGLRSVSAVTVPLADGRQAPVLKLVADRIVITDFLLDVRHATGPSLVSTATTMTLDGHVQVYVDSLTATLLDGLGISLLAPTPPPGDELPPRLLRVTLGLVGVTADSITFDDSHQRLHE